MGQTSKEYFKYNKIIFIALLTGQIVFAMVCVLLNKDKPVNDTINGNETNMLIVAIISLSLLIASFYIPRIRLEKIRQVEDIKRRLYDYRATLIIKFALVEGATLFAIVQYLLTGSIYILGFAALLILVSLTNWPSQEKTIKELELNKTDIDIINDPNAIVWESNS